MSYRITKKVFPNIKAISWRSKSILSILKQISQPIGLKIFAGNNRQGWLNHLHPITSKKIAIDTTGINFSKWENSICLSRMQEILSWNWRSNARKTKGNSWCFERNSNRENKGSKWSKSRSQSNTFSLTIFAKCKKWSIISYFINPGLTTGKVEVYKELKGNPSTDQRRKTAIK